jgi:hypothetical protein
MGWGSGACIYWFLYLQMQLNGRNALKRRQIIAAKLISKPAYRLAD